MIRTASINENLYLADTRLIYLKKDSLLFLHYKTMQNKFTCYRLVAEFHLVKWRV